MYTPARIHDKSAIDATAVKYDARIIRDAWGMAHIFGKTDPDTSFGLGYSHAEDDWATIQIFVQALQGESARYQGKAAAPCRLSL
ncbi:MAG: penicillin acylase family protein [Hyphomonadaceae bacterium]|nr:penicillin acylase family protein [Hyphomonadaceae bacterium]